MSPMKVPHFSELPRMGLGLSADVASVQPDFRALITKNAAFDYLNLGAHYTQEERLRHYVDDLVSCGFPIVFHPVNFNLAHPAVESVAVVDAITRICRYLNAVWVGQDVAIWHLGPQYLGAYLIPPVATVASAKDVARKVRLLSEALGLPFLIENPPVTFPVGDIHMVDFINVVSQEADCGIVLDIGHLLGYENSVGGDWRHAKFQGLMFDRVVEVHVAGLQFSRVGEDVNIIDQHAYPVHDECWRFLETHLEQMANLKGVTLEQEYCPTDLVEEHLGRANRILKAWRP